MVVVVVGEGLRAPGIRSAPPARRLSLQVLPRPLLHHLTRTPFHWSLPLLLLRVPPLPHHRHAHHAQLLVLPRRRHPLPHLLVRVAMLLRPVMPTRSLLQAREESAGPRHPHQEQRQRQQRRGKARWGCWALPKHCWAAEGTLSAALLLLPASPMTRMAPTMTSAGMEEPGTTMTKTAGRRIRRILARN